MEALNLPMKQRVLFNFVQDADSAILGTEPETEKSQVEEKDSANAPLSLASRSHT